MKLPEDPKDDTTEQPTIIETKIATTVKVEDTEAFANTWLLWPVPSDPNAYLKPINLNLVSWGTMEDASVSANDLCNIRADDVVFKGPYYQMRVSLKENDKKFADSAQSAMDMAVVFAYNKYRVMNTSLLHL